MLIHLFILMLNICTHKYSDISYYTHIFILSYFHTFILYTQSDLKNQRSSDARPAVAGYNYDPIDVKIARKKLLVRRLRSIIINTGKRSDGRGVEDVRPITIDTSLLPGAHGSSLFTRGETQSLSTATLGKHMEKEMRV
jgi:polyribonucleotide nucleotidyltransferase